MIDEHHKPLVDKIKAFLEETGMSPSYFGKVSVGNSELVRRLYEGGSVTVKTQNLLLKYMKENKSKRIKR